MSKSKPDKSKAQGATGGVLYRKKNPKIKAVSFIIFSLFILILLLQVFPNKHFFQNDEYNEFEDEYVAPVDGGFTPGAEPPIIEQQASKIAEAEEIVQNDIALATEEGKEHIISAKTMQEYRLFLANAAEMLANARNNKPYDDELVEFKQIVHPAHIIQILDEIETLRQALDELKAKGYEELHPFNYEFVSKLIRIRVIHDKGLAHDLLQQKMEDNLQSLHDYIYSYELQTRLVK